MAEKAKDEDALLGDEENEEESQFAPSSQSATVLSEPDEWDDDKYVWDKKELEDINKKRDIKDVLPIILRHPDSMYGIRSYPEMTPWICLKSVFVPWMNEFICIWIYLIFTLYFWVQLALVIAQTKSVGAENSTDEYDFNNKEDYELMFIATLGICLSLSMTTGYLIFYSLDHERYELLQTLNFMGILIMSYAFTFAWVGSELQHTHYFFYLLFLTTVLLITCMVLLQYGLGRTLSLWISGIYLGVLYIIDFLFLSSKKQTTTFYVPLIIEGTLFLIGAILVTYRIPERWCKQNRVVALYFNSYVIMAIILVNVIFEMHTVLYYTIKLNSNYLDDYDIWWKVTNVYNDDKQQTFGNSTITGR